MEGTLRGRFADAFGGEPTLLAVAPGRVNLIGEHTDYNEGFVFPAAIDRQLYVAARVNHGRTRPQSHEMGPGDEFHAATVMPGQVEGWTAYAAGIAWALREEGFEDLPDVEAYVLSDVPIGSGISSSAALELAFAVLWNELARLELSPVELAQVGQKCENRFVGVNSGIMDQMASAMGKAGHAMFLDTRSLAVEYAPIPEDLAIVICDTGKPRALTDSAYNERRMQCEAAAQALGVVALRDADLSQLEAKRGALDPTVYRRARHVIAENERCRAFASALGDHDLPKIGEMMRASHLSLRDDYEVSSPELDAMAEAAWAAPGCVGARMTGAGFGGACVALVEKVRYNEFEASVFAGYQRRVEVPGELHKCEAVDGARTLTSG
jgi:galactokinase